MRVYVPATVDALRGAFDAGVVRAVDGTAFAVTPALRREYIDADEDELEYLAMRDAAVASLRLIAGAGAAVLPLRVVVAADIEGEVAAGPGRDAARADVWGSGPDQADAADADPPTADVVDAGHGSIGSASAAISSAGAGAVERPDLDRAAVRLKGPIPWKRVAAVHVDGADASSAVLDAVAVVDAADLGDVEAEFALGTVEDIDLCWYDPGEVVFLVNELGPDPGR